MPYYEKRIKSGDYIEIERYYGTKAGARFPRNPQTLPTTDEQAALNERGARKKIQRSMLCNFPEGCGGIFLTVTNPDGTTKVVAMREVGNFIKRWGRRCKKKGMPEPRYLVCHEKQGQWHSHIIITAPPVAWEEIQTLWGRGRVTISPLDPSNGYAELVEYLLSEEKLNEAGENTKEPRPKHGRRWSSSRNLLKPEIERIEITKDTIMRKTPKAPRGYKLLPEWYMGTDGNGYYYQAFTCVRLAAVRKRQ